MDLTSEAATANLTVDHRGEALSAIMVEEPYMRHAAIGMAASSTTMNDVLTDNLTQIFCERDPARRAGAIQRLWHPTAMIYGGHRSGTGYAALTGFVTRFQAQIGAAQCEALGPVSSHDGFHMLRWITRHRNERMLSGCHLVSIRDDRIDSCYLFTD